MLESLWGAQALTESRLEELERPESAPPAAPTGALPSGVRNVFDDPSVFDGTGADSSHAEWNPAPPPSFQTELNRFRTIDRDFDGSDQWTPIIDQWIEDVRRKLEAWNPRNAQRFTATSLATMLAVSQVSAEMMGRPDLHNFPELRRLHMARNRLQEIVGDHG
jgi:hypothetical protein